MRLWSLLLVGSAWLVVGEARAEEKVKTEIKVSQTDEYVEIETDALTARIRKKGYVSGVAAGSLLDKKTGAHDVGFGLHIMDFLLAPGWRDDGYERDPKLHGRLPKHYVEGPQICTQAKALKPEVIKGEGFAAVRLRYTFTKPGKGYKAGSTWELTHWRGAAMKDSTRVALPASASVQLTAEALSVKARTSNGGIDVTLTGTPAQGRLDIYVSYELEVNVDTSLTPAIDDLNTDGPIGVRCEIASQP